VAGGTVLSSNALRLLNTEKDEGLSFAPLSASQFQRYISQAEILVGYNPSYHLHGIALFQRQDISPVVVQAVEPKVAVFICGNSNNLTCLCILQGTFGADDDFLLFWIIKRTGDKLLRQMSLIHPRFRPGGRIQHLSPG